MLGGTANYSVCSKNFRESSVPDTRLFLFSINFCSIHRVVSAPGVSALSRGFQNRRVFGLKRSQSRGRSIYSSAAKGKTGNGHGESRCTFSFATTRDVKIVELDGASCLHILQEPQGLITFTRIAARAFPRRLKCVKSRLVSHEHELLLYLQRQRRR